MSHSIGAVDINMGLNQVDYAIGCTYKYLNGGPGSPAFIYVREQELRKLKSPLEDGLVMINHLSILMNIMNQIPLKNFQMEHLIYSLYLP